MKLEDLQKIPNAALPTAGQGLTLDHNGLLSGTVLAPSPADLSLLQWNNTKKQSQWATMAALAPTLAGYRFNYVQFTANVTVTATTEATANTVVTAGAVVFDGATTINVDFYCMQAAPGTSRIDLYLYDGTSIGDMGEIAGATQGPLFLSRVLTPSAASHTYSIRASVDAGTGTIVAGAGGSTALMPGFIRITRA